MQTIYRPGQWYLIVLPGALVALPPAVSADVVRRLWERLLEQRTFATVVDVLTSHAGGAVTSLPSFAAAVVEGGGARVALRGEVAAHVSTAIGSHEFSGAEVTTWSERFVGGASRVEITVEAVEGGAGLPVQSGVVRAATASAELESREPTSAAPAAEPEPLDEPSTETGTGPAEPVAEPEVVDEATLAPTEVTLASSAEDDDLWGATVMSAREAGSGADTSTPEDDDRGDHDGATISLAELRAQRRQAVPGAAVPAAGALPAAIPGSSGTSGRVRVSTGQVVALDRTVIIGRRPRSPRASGANLPHLIAVDSPEQDISRSHLEIRPEGDTVVVIDLHTTNGSTLLRPAADPVRLHPGEQTLVLSGDVVDLGDGVTVAFEDLP